MKYFSLALVLILFGCAKVDQEIKIVVPDECTKEKETESNYYMPPIIPWKDTPKPGYLHGLDPKPLNEA